MFYKLSFLWMDLQIGFYLNELDQFIKLVDIFKMGSLDKKNSAEDKKSFYFWSKWLNSFFIQKSTNDCLNYGHLTLGFHKNHLARMVVKTSIVVHRTHNLVYTHFIEFIFEKKKC